MIEFKNFERNDPIHFYKTGLSFSNGIIDMEVLDTFLLISNQYDSTNLSVIGLNSMRVKNKLIRRGKDRDQALNISDIIKTDKENMLFTFDITQRKFLKFDLKDIIKGEPHPIDVINVEDDSLKGLKSPVYVSEDVFGANSYFLEDSRFIIFNQRTHETKEIGELPPALESWPDPSQDKKKALRSMSYTALLKKQPSFNRYVVAYTTTPRLEFYEGDNLVQIVVGPDRFDPTYKFAKDRNGVFPIEYEKTLFSFVKIKADNGSIYALYSGKEGAGSCANKLVIFDWHGTPKRVVNLGFTVCSFAVRTAPEGLHTVYVIDQGSGELLTGSF